MNREMRRVAILVSAAFVSAACFAARPWTPKETSGVSPALTVDTGSAALNAHFAATDVFAVPESLGRVGRLRAHWKFSGNREAVARSLFALNEEQRTAGYADPVACRHLCEMNAILGLVPERAEFAAHMANNEEPLPIDAQYMKTVGIVPDPEQFCYAGFHAVLIAPVPDPSIRFARAVLETQSGRFVSHWRYEGDTLVWDLEIPDEVEKIRAMVPGEKVPRRLKAGRHHFAVTGAAAEPIAWKAVEIDVSSLPDDKRFLGDIVAARIRERVPAIGLQGGLKIRFAMDGTVPGEDAKVTVRGGVAAVRAGRFRGLVYGAGKLLKSFEYRTDSFISRDGDYGFHPAKDIRMSYFIRHFLNFYMDAPPEVQIRYLDDLALDGINGVQLYFSMPPVDAAREGEAAREAFLETSLALFDRMRALDLDVAVDGGQNLLPEDSPQSYRGVPNTDMHRGNLGFNVCPSKPEVMAALRKFWDDGLKPLDGRKIDYFRYWSFDEGGCECEKCSPYGEKMLITLMETLRADHAKAFPNAKTMLSTWMFHDSDYAALWKYLEAHDTIDVLLIDHTGEFPRYPLEHPLPKGCKTKIITFPEISMWGRKPWGGFGATAFPKRLYRLFKVAEPISSGCQYYTEGIYEDINKWFVTALYVDPAAKPDEILGRYAIYHFPGANSDDFVRLVDLMEDNHVIKGMTVGRADEMVKLVKKMDADILPSMRGSWRWRQVYLRALIDREIIREGRDDPVAATPWFEELVGIYCVRRQLELWRSGYTPCGWTTPHFGKRKERNGE